VPAGFLIFLVFLTPPSLSLSYRFNLLISNLSFFFSMFLRSFFYPLRFSFSLVRPPHPSAFAFVPTFFSGRCSLRQNPLPFYPLLLAPPSFSYAPTVPFTSLEKLLPKFSIFSRAVFVGGNFLHLPLTVPPVIPPADASPANVRSFKKADFKPAVAPLSFVFLASTYSLCPQF